MKWNTLKKNLKAMPLSKTMKRYFRNKLMLRFKIDKNKRLDDKNVTKREERAKNVWNGKNGQKTKIDETI